MLAGPAALVFMAFWARDVDLGVIGMISGVPRAVRTNEIALEITKRRKAC